jgi:predicted nucleotidyltransferase component of viral defense system
MNSMQVKDKIRNISNNKNIDFSVLLRSYMYERFIERLANSKYRNNFILKGGYYLSIVFGLDSRHTLDIDLCLKNKVLSEENIKIMINEIININIEDNTEITFDGISNIREEDKYGGYRVKITVKIENIRETFNIDIATGDPITPREIVFKYKTMFEYKFLNLKSYNLETILAEKLETILSKKDLSSRLKDYYDIYLISTLAKDKIDLNVLRNAMDRTFQKRKFNANIKENFEIIKNSELLLTRWNAYAVKNNIKNLSYEDVINCLEDLIKIIELVTV